MPAFLRADVAGELDRVTPSFYLTSGFDDETRFKLVGGVSEGTWTARARARWGALTSAQVAAVVKYLELVVDRDGAEVSSPVLEALVHYWRPRLESESIDLT
jgi:hypothetical protein